MGRTCRSTTTGSWPNTWLGASPRAVPCWSFARHGARRHYVLNTGISTVKALEPARLLLKKEGIRMEFTDLRRAHSAVEDKVRESEGGTHADELETSMMLYMAPEIVRMR